MLFNLTTLFYHASLLFLNYWLTLLIPAVTAQIFSPITELKIPIGIPNNEANAEMERHPVIVEITISRW